MNNLFQIDFFSCSIMASTDSIFCFLFLENRYPNRNGPIINASMNSWIKANILLYYSWWNLREVLNILLFWSYYSFCLWLCTYRSFFFFFSITRNWSYCMAFCLLYMRRSLHLLLQHNRSDIVRYWTYCKLLGFINCISRLVPINDCELKISFK
jgi:hypothetical protein